MSTKFFPSTEQGSLTLMGGRHDPEIYKTTTWRPPRMADLPSWKGAQRIGFDYETKDTDLQELGPGVRRPGNYVVGYSFCIEDRTSPASMWPKYYVPFRHGHDNISGSYEDNVEGDALGYLRDQMKEFDGELVGANLPYELDWSWEMGIMMPKVKRFLDVQVADPLLYELHDFYSLDHISKRRNCGGKNETTAARGGAPVRARPQEGHVDDAGAPRRSLRRGRRAAAAADYAQAGKGHRGAGHRGKLGRGVQAPAHPRAHDAQGRSGQPRPPRYGRAVDQGRGGTLLRHH
jgi:hypothetical protein